MPGTKATYNMRTVIIGNSGSGKTWLAKRLADTYATTLVHMDDIFWMPGGFNVKRDPAEVSNIVAMARAEPGWVAEGVFGSLASQFLQSATTLIWLDLPWDVCRARLVLRGSESKAHMDREQSQAGLQALLEWAKDYPFRQGSSGRAAHSALFDAFRGQQSLLCSEQQVLAYLADKQPVVER